MIRFLANNLMESAVLTPSTVDAQFPVSNIKSDFRTKVFRSTSNSDNIVVDLGLAAEVDSFAIVSNWQDGFGISSLTIEANATDSWMSPSFSTSITLDNTYGVGMKIFASQSYRYWRIVMTSTLGYCEVPHFFLGKNETISTNGINFGWRYKNNDNIQVSTSRYGQKFIDDISQQRELSNLSFSVLNQAELETLFSVFDNRRTVKPMYVKIGNDDNVIVADEDRLNGLYYFNDEPSFTNSTAGFWDTNMTLTEAM